MKPDSRGFLAEMHKAPFLKHAPLPQEDGDAICAALDKCETHKDFIDTAVRMVREARDKHYPFLRKDFVWPKPDAEGLVELVPDGDAGLFKISASKRRAACVRVPD